MNSPELDELKAQLDDLSRRMAVLERRFVTNDPERQPHQDGIQIKQPGSDASARRYSLESKVGGQYLNRAGVLALLAAASFFLHWAFSNHWITPTMQIVVGIVVGLAVFAWGEWFVHRDYSSFGFYLKALGVGTLYLSVWAAMQFYHLVPAWIAFAGMVVITAITTLVAVLQNSENLAVFACIGGFATPLLISSGPLVRAELLLYMLVLTLGMLTAVIFRAWPNLLLVTAIGYAVVDTWSIAGKAKNLTTLGLTTLFMLAFVLAPILISRFNATKLASARVLVVPILSSFVFLEEAEGALGWHDSSAVIAVLGIGLVVLALFLNARLKAVYLTLGVAALVSAVPMRFDTHWTTSLLWLGLSAVLVVFGFMRHQPVERWNGLVLILLTLAKVFLLDLRQLSQGSRVLITTLLGVMLLALSFAYQKLWAKG